MDSSLAVLSKGLFSEVDLDALDPQEHAGYIIPRVMDYGSWEDVQYIWKLYGPARIKSILLNAPSLQKKTISFFAIKFEIPQEDFKAYHMSKEAQWNR